MNIGIVYWLGGICEGIGVLCLVLGVIGGIAAVVATVYALDGDWYSDDLKKKVWKVLKISYFALPALLITAVLVPDRKTVVAMYVLPKIAQNEKIQAISDKALDRIVRILDCDLDGKNGGTGDGE